MRSMNCITVNSLVMTLYWMLSSQRNWIKYIYIYTHTYNWMWISNYLKIRISNNNKEVKRGGGWWGLAAFSKPGLCTISRGQRRLCSACLWDREELSELLYLKRPFSQNLSFLEVTKGFGSVTSSQRYLLYQSACWPLAGGVFSHSHWDTVTASSKPV